MATTQFSEARLKGLEGLEGLSNFSRREGPKSQAIFESALARMDVSPAFGRGLRGAFSEISQSPEKFAQSAIAHALQSAPTQSNAPQAGKFAGLNFQFPSRTSTQDQNKPKDQGKDR